MLFLFCLSILSFSACYTWRLTWETSLISFIGLDNSGNQVNIFLISPQKHVIGTHWKYLSEALVMSTCKIYFMEKEEKDQYFWIEKKHLIKSYEF